MEPRQTCIFVLGMHRSGTSALTRALALRGADLPRTVMGAGPGNETGHWEPEKLVRLHDALLGEAGSAWDDYRQLRLDPPSPFADPAGRAGLRRQIGEDFGASPLFVLKDPRISRFLPVYRSILDEAGMHQVAVISCRPPMAVARSLIARRAFPVESVGYASLLWLRHMLDAERYSRGMPRTFVSYASLLDDWRAVTDAVAGRLGLTWPVEADAAAPAIEDFLDKDLAHHPSQDGGLFGRDDVPALVDEAEKVLARFLDDPMSEEGMAAFDRIAAALDAAALVGDRVYAEFSRRGSALGAEIARLQALPAAATTALSELEARFISTNDELLAARRDLARIATERDGQIASLSNELAAASESLEAAQQGLARATSEWGIAHERLTAEAAALQQEIAEANRRADQEAAIRERQDAALARLNADLAHAIADRGRLEEDVAQLRAVQEHLEAEGRRLSSEHADAARHWAEADAAAGRTIGELGQANTRLQEQNDDLARRADRLEADLARHRAQLDRQAVELDARMQALAEARWQAAALRSALDHARTAAEAMLASSSWRLTRPLRSLKQVMSGHAPGDAQLPVPLLTPGPKPRIAFFTICSRNFTPYARVLSASLRDHYPDAPFFAALADSAESHAPFDRAAEPFTFIGLDELDLPQWREMAQRYNITEFNTAIKPFVFNHLLARNVADVVVYLDPDIVVTSRMAELEDALAAGAEAVLTPHVLQPAENVEVHDQKMLQFGIYNLGRAELASGSRSHVLVGPAPRPGLHDPPRAGHLRRPEMGRPVSRLSAGHACAQASRLQRRLLEHRPAVGAAPG